MQPSVSVIIPVYNIEKHLEKCLDSVIGQTLKDIEIIVVNDGSTDNSLDIITQYARKDSRIVIVDKPNEGLAYARKSGIEAAHGKYVQHLDGDDFLEPDACELLFKRAEETDADIVIMRFLNHPCRIVSINCLSNIVVLWKYFCKCIRSASCNDIFF